LLRDDPELAIRVLTQVEIESALWRRHRGGDIRDNQRVKAQRRFNETVSVALAISDIFAVASRARRLLATHNLRSANALQLAAALLACDDEPARLPFVTLDDRLADAATREGFTVLP